MQALARSEEAPASRRCFVQRAALAGASGVAAFARPGPGRSAQLDLPFPAADDVWNLRLLLDLEHLAYALYDDATQRFGEDALVRRLVLQEVDHVGLLTALLLERGGSPGAVPVYDFGDADAYGFVQVAAAIENALVGAYVAILPAIKEPFLRRVLTSLLAVEARHAAFFNDQAGAPAFPRAREGAASRIASLLVIERYRAR